MTASRSPSTDTSPHSLGPALSGEMAAASDKSKRYDRGIRVWGAHGQEALEAARVCLLNAGPTGTEALKNLVLGGIKFPIAFFPAFFIPVHAFWWGLAIGFVTAFAGSVMPSLTARSVKVSEVFSKVT